MGPPTYSGHKPLQGSPSEFDFHMTFCISHGFLEDQNQQNGYTHTHILKLALKCINIALNSNSS